MASPKVEEEEELTPTNGEVVELDELARHTLEELGFSKVSDGVGEAERALFSVEDEDDGSEIREDENVDDAENSDDEIHRLIHKNNGGH